MAFKFDCLLDGYEFRGYQSGRLDDGNEWHKMILEAPDDPNQLRVTVGSDLWPDLLAMGITKGDILVLDVEASSGTYNGKPFDRVRLNELPQVVDEEGEVH